MIQTPFKIGDKVVIDGNIENCGIIRNISQEMSNISQCINTTYEVEVPQSGYEYGLKDYLYCKTEELELHKYVVRKKKIEKLLE